MKFFSFTELNYEIVQTSQREEVKLGVLGYPEQATAELGRKMAEECVENGSKLLQKAIAAADEARRNGTRITHDNGALLKIRSI